MCGRRLLRPLRVRQLLRVLSPCCVLRSCYSCLASDIRMMCIRHAYGCVKVFSPHAHKRNQAGSITNVMLRARAVSSAITTRGANAGETMLTSGCRLPSPTNDAHKNKQRREPRQDSTNWQVQVQTHSLSTRQRTECAAHTRTRTSGRKVQNPSARRHSLSAWAENDGDNRVSPWASVERIPTLQAP